MILERIELSGFGRLRDFFMDFNCGLNVISGPNEAGKSTLLSAMLALLYGHREEAADPNDETSDPICRFQPWHAGQFGGALLVRLASGDVYRIERRFGTEETKIYREPGASDVTDRYSPGQHGWVSFADEHLGLSAAEFRAVACVNQDSLSLERDDVRALQRCLETFADSAGTERSAQEAIQNLDKQFREQVNPDARLVERSPLKLARWRVNELTAETERSQRALAEVATMVLRGQDLGAQVRALQEEIHHLDVAIARREEEDLIANLDRLTTIENRLASLDAELATLSDVSGLDEESFAQAFAVVRDVSRLDNAYREVDDRVKAESDERTRIESELATTTADLTALPTNAEASLADVREAEHAVRDWATASRRAEEARQAVASLQSRCQQLTESLPSDVEALPVSTEVRDLEEAILRAHSSAGRLANDEQQIAGQGVPPQLIEEHDSLLKALDGLTGERLSSLREQERRLHQAEQEPTGLSLAVRLWIAFLAGLVGVAAGYALRGMVGAIVGGLVLAALAILATVVIQLRATEETDLVLEKNRSIRANMLGRYGVTSVEDLQRKWDRLADLSRQVSDVVRLQKALDASRAEHEQDVARVAELCGTGEADEANQRLALLRQRTAVEGELAKESAALDTAVARSEVAEAAFGSSRETAVAALTKLDLSAEMADAASEALVKLVDLLDRRRQLVSQQSSLSSVLTAFEERVRQRDLLAKDLSAAKDGARDRFLALEVDPGSSDPATEVEQRQIRFRSYQRLSRERNVQADLYSQLIGNGDPESWRQQSDILRARFPGEIATDPRPLAELRVRRDEAGNELRVAEAEAARANAQVNGRWQGVREPAAIAEDLAAAERDLGQLQRLANAIEDARALLTEVAEDHRRDFAPRLSTAVSDRLSRVTSGRYQLAEVDPADLAVRLQSNEYGNLVTLAQVSRGTQDAVTLLLRASIAELLSRASEPVPLFLDDVLVHIDSDRTVQLLATLGELAADHQLFYFTHDPRIAALAGSFGKARVHHLAGP
ncbi:MAG TPA: AAA family ATPase [Chloroflexota bacterium]|nr:AAA family ATPase [Chloroflexota bacterium]